MFGNFSNNVQTAVDRVGGPTKAAHTMGVANATVHSWIKNQRVPNIDQAKKLGQLSNLNHELLRRVK